MAKLIRQSEDDERAAENSYETNTKFRHICVEDNTHKHKNEHEVNKAYSGFSLEPSICFTVCGSGSSMLPVFFQSVRCCDWLNVG